MKTCFILDDVRTIKVALFEARLVTTRGHLPLSDTFYSLARNIDDGMNVVLASPKFDLWVLDNDLGIRDGRAEEGYEFLKRCINEFGHKVPDKVVSCSSNPLRREAIEALHQNWLDAGRVPLDPVTE